MSEDKLSNNERRLFDQLPRTKEPPRSLEKNILNKMKKEGLLAEKANRQVYWKWSMSLAASILLFISGIYFERINTSEMIEIEPTKGYVLLLHEDNRFSPGDPMEMYTEYNTWMTETFEKGVKITGQELKEEAVLVDQGGQTSTASAERRTTGYFILEAENLEMAVQVAQKNPHIKYGGTIEVKPYMVR